MKKVSDMNKTADVFPPDIRKLAFERAGDQCECISKKCGHLFRCGSVDELEAHHIDRSKGDTLDNCRVLCQDCHEMTESYGKPR